MKTINKNQLYAFCKRNGACKGGLRRLRSMMRSGRTARDILHQYRKCHTERYINSTCASTCASCARARDYEWIVRICYIWRDPSDVGVQAVINKIVGAKR